MPVPYNGGWCHSRLIHAMAGWSCNGGPDVGPCRARAARGGAGSACRGASGCARFTVVRVVRGCWATNHAGIHRKRAPNHPHSGAWPGRFNTPMVSSVQTGAAHTQRRNTHALTHSRRRRLLPAHSLILPFSCARGLFPIDILTRLWSHITIDPKGLPFVVIPDGRNTQKEVVPIQQSRHDGLSPVLSAHPRYRSTVRKPGMANRLSGYRPVSVEGACMESPDPGSQGQARVRSGPRRTSTS